MKKFLLLLAGSGLATISLAQQTRLNDHNTIGWLVYSGDHRVLPKWALHTEYQWRRVQLLGRPQQQLARLGIVRAVGERVKLAVGYAYTRTYRYGQYPVVAGRPQPEQRLYQDVVLSDELGRLRLAHRLRLEQRWLGQRPNEGQGQVSGWQYQNRIRYQLSGRFPLQGPTIDAGEWYLNAFDELFIGFGRNVGQNVFDQNRLSGGVGYQFSSQAKVELSYLNQISQGARPEPVSGRQVFEINHGLRLNVLVDLDLTGNRAAPAD